jgi:hypothetical protein
VTIRSSAPYDELRVQFAERTAEGFNFQCSSRLGELKALFRIPFHKWELERALASVDRFSQNWVQRSAQLETLDPVKQIGAQLFSALFEGTLGDIYRFACEQTLSTGIGLRLRLVMRDFELAELPWEFLYDPSRRDFLALSAQTSIAREWNEHLADFTNLPPVEEVRVLMVAGQFERMPGIQQEIATLRRLESSGLLHLEVVADSSIPLFLTALRNQQYEVIIFSGTGGMVPASDDGCPQALFFEYPPRSHEMVLGSKELVEAMREQMNLRLIYLSACNTDLLAAELGKVVPAAIGMRGAPTDNACVAFTTKLMDTALQGLWLDAAIADGRRAIDLLEPGNRSWGVPVFYLGARDGLRVREPRRPEEAARIIQTDPVVIGGVQVLRRNASAQKQRQLDELQTLLAIQEQNIADLLKQTAGFSENVPGFLRAQLQDAEAKADVLKQQIEALT